VSAVVADGVESGKLFGGVRLGQVGGGGYKKAQGELGQWVFECLDECGGVECGC
jgi:hypothetical protein